MTGIAVVKVVTALLLAAIAINTVRGLWPIVREKWEYFLYLTGWE